MSNDVSPSVNRGAGNLARVAVFSMIFIFAGTLVVLAVPSLREQAMLRLAAHPGYRVGSRIDIDKRTYEGRNHTVVIFGRASCAACRAAEPVFGDMVRLASETTRARAVFVATGSDGADGRLFALGAGFQDSDVLEAKPSELRLRVVPTIAVVDKNGRVEFVSEDVTADKRETISASVADVLKRVQ